MLVSVAVAMLAAVSCGDKDSAPAVAGVVELDIDSVVVDTIVPLAGGDDAPSLELSISVQYDKTGKMPVLKDSIIMSRMFHTDVMAGGDSIKTVKGAVEAFASGIISGYKEDYGSLYAADKEHPEAYGLTVRINAWMESHREGIVSYIIVTYVRYGDLEDYSIFITYNVDVEKGKILTLDDVFVPGYKLRLTEKIVKKICEKNDAESFEDLQEMGCFAGMNAYPPDNFVMGDEEIIFIYNPYEITPWGFVSVAIDYDDLKDLLRK